MRWPTLPLSSKPSSLNAHRPTAFRNVSRDVPGSVGRAPTQEPLMGKPNKWMRGQCASESFCAHGRLTRRRPWWIPPACSHSER